MLVTNCRKLESQKASRWFPDPKHACGPGYVLPKATEMVRAVTPGLSTAYSFLAFQLELFYFSDEIILSCPKEKR